MNGVTKIQLIRCSVVIAKIDLALRKTGILITVDDVRERRQYWARLGKVDRPVGLSHRA